jgi:protoporphyrinogen oxidase
VAAIRARAATLPRLALAGAAYEGVGIPQVIASGQRAAVTVGYVRNDRSKA